MDITVAMKEGKEYIVSMDAGKDSVKLKGICFDHIEDILHGELEKINSVTFKTRMYDLKDGYIDVDGNSHRVQHEDHDIIVGEQGSRGSYQTSKTNFLHQVCAYTAITQILEPNTKNKIHMVLACPISQLKSEASKQAYKDMIKGKGEINITVDNKHYNFEIVDVILKAEGSGVVYLSPELFKNKRVVVIDIGGLNLTPTLFTNGVCKDPQKDRFSDELGATQLTTYIADALTEYLDGNIVDDATAEVACEKGYMVEFGKQVDESIPYVSKAKQRFLEEACEKIDKRGMDLKSYDDIIFVGGTSQRISEQIKKKFPTARVTENSQWTNADGLFKVAVGMYSKKLK